MTNSIVSISTRDLERYARFVKGPFLKAFKSTTRALLNNMAFGIREEIYQYLPRVMTIRNKRFIESNIRITKATKSRETALLGSVARQRFTGMREQEFGGVLSRQGATLAARGKSRKKQMQSKARLKPGKILKPDDIEMVGEKSYAHRVHVFMLMLQRKTAMIGHHKGSFIIPRGGGWKGGLLKLGKLKRYDKAQRKTRRRKDTKSRRVVTLQNFSKRQTRVRRRRWMKPSIEKYLRRHDAKMEWRRLMKRLISRTKL